MKEEAFELTKTRIETEGLFKGIKFFTLYYEKNKKNFMVP